MSVLLAVLVAGQAAPVSPEAGDLRCLAAFSYLASKSGETAEAGKLGAIMFYGKLVGRNPRVDVNGGLRGAVGYVQANTQSEILRCSKELERAGNAMTAAGKALMR